jgi:hypothetical protein
MRTLNWCPLQKQRGEVSFTARKLIYERALKALPGSFKLWNMYLRERRDRIKHKCITDPAYESLNNTYERALVFMHKMPRCDAMRGLMKEIVRIDNLAWCIHALLHYDIFHGFMFQDLAGLQQSVMDAALGDTNSEDL